MAGGLGASSEPIARLDGDRVRFSLTSVSAAVLVFVLLVVVFGSFEIGRRFGDRRGFQRGHIAGRASYSADALSEIEAARRQPPATQLLAPLRVDAESDPTARDAAPGDSGTPPPEGPTWVRDYTYIVVQEFSAGRQQDARQAQAFMAEHGIGTEMVKYPSGAIQLITTQGYNRQDPTQRRLADQFLEKVHMLGAQYFAAGGGYRLEGYFKSLKGDTW
jgi:hypothetical protein